MASIFQHLDNFKPRWLLRPSDFNESGFSFIINTGNFCNRVAFCDFWYNVFIYTLSNESRQVYVITIRSWRTLTCGQYAEPHNRTKRSCKGSGHLVVSWGVVCYLRTVCPTGKQPSPYIDTSVTFRRPITCDCCKMNVTWCTRPDVS